HRVPTGFIDRHLLLLAEGTDRDGKVLAPRAGPLLPAAAGAALAGKPRPLFAQLLTHGPGPHPAPLLRARPGPVATRPPPRGAVPGTGRYGPAPGGPGARRLRLPAGPAPAAPAGAVPPLLAGGRPGQGLAGRGCSGGGPGRGLGPRPNLGGGRPAPTAEHPEQPEPGPAAAPAACADGVV